MKGITPGILIFGHNLAKIMYDAGFSVVQLVGFLPNVPNFRRDYRTAAEKAASVPRTRLPVRPQALGFRVYSIIPDYAGICLHARETVRVELGKSLANILYLLPRERLYGLATVR